LGGLSRGKLSLRVVVSSTTEGTHQPVGDDRSSFGLVSFQNNSSSQISGSGNRQYYRSRLSEKPGRHSLSKISKTPDLEKTELPFPFGKQEFVDRNP
jgi:hypothetical protein